MNVQLFSRTSYVMQDNHSDSKQEIGPLPTSGIQLELKKLEPISLSRFLDDKSATLVSKANKKIDDLPDNDINLKICQIPHMINAVKHQANQYKRNGKLSDGSINKSVSLSVNLPFTNSTFEHFHFGSDQTKDDMMAYGNLVDVNIDSLNQYSKSEVHISQTTKDSTADSNLKISGFEKEEPRIQSTLFRKATVKVMTQNKQVKILNQLIEDFLIIGPDKSSVLSSDINADLKYKLCHQSKTELDLIRQNSQLVSYLIPFGQKKTDLSESPLSVQMISERLCSQWSIDKKMEFFFVPLISNIMGQNFAEQHAAIFSAERSKFEVLLEVNPESFYYYYCAKYEDFIIDFTDTESEDWMTKMRIHSFPRYYVLKTVYPFTKLMKSLLHSVLSAMIKRKLDLLALYILTGVPRKEFLKRIDADGFAKEESQIVELLQEEFAKIQITDNFLVNIQLQIGDTMVRYSMPPREMAFLAAVEDSFYEVLQLFAFEEFMLIFLSILSGKTIVFVSKSLRKISAIISSFLAVIKPLQWLYPIIYSLPHDCIDFLNAPFPMLMGVNRSSDTFLQEMYPLFVKQRVLAKLSPSQSTHIFVYVDEMAFDFDPELLDSLYIPSSENIVNELKLIYRKNINPLRSDFARITKPFLSKSAEYRFEKKTTLSTSDYIKKYRGLQIKRQQKKKSLKVSDSNPKAFLNYFKSFFQNSVISKIRVNKNEDKNGMRKKLDRFSNELMKSDSFQFYVAKSMEEVV